MKEIIKDRDLRKAVPEKEEACAAAGAAEEGSPARKAAFRVSREDCYAAYKKAVLEDPWAGRRRMLKARPEDFRAVYVPCAMFDAWVTGDLQVNGSKTTDVKGDTVIDSFRTNTRLNYRYEKVLVSLVPGIDSWRLRAEADDLAARPGKETEAAETLPGDPDRESAANSARRTVARNVRRCVAKELREKYSHIRYRSPNETTLFNMVTLQDAGDALIPAWILERGKGKHGNRAFMNGVTGEIWTDPDMNLLRYLLTTAYISLLAFVPLFLLFRAAEQQLSFPFQIPAAVLSLLMGALISLAIREKKKARKALDGGVPLRPTRSDLKIRVHTIVSSHRIPGGDD